MRSKRGASLWDGDIVWPAWKHAAVVYHGGQLTPAPEHSDEEQAEVTKNLVRWHVLQENTCKPANASATIEARGKKYYATSPVADLLLEAVEEVNKQFKLNVPLAIEWIVGTNWAEAH